MLRTVRMLKIVMANVDFTGGRGADDEDESHNGNDEVEDVWMGGVGEDDMMRTIMVMTPMMMIIIII